MINRVKFPWKKSPGSPRPKPRRPDAAATAVHPDVYSHHTLALTLSVCCYVLTPLPRLNRDNSSGGRQQAVLGFRS